MRTIPAAVLFHLDTLTIVDLVLFRDVVTTLALLTRKCDVDALLIFSHESNPVSFVSIIVERIEEVGRKPTPSSIPWCK
jgi:hypothetical protein